jgi:hypothetical protein
VIHPQTVQTNEVGAKRANKFLKEFVITPVNHSKSSLFKSFFGKFKIANVEIEVMGDFKCFIKNKWISFPNFHHHELVDVDGFKIPVPYLEDQFKAYKKLGRDKDLEKIKMLQKKFNP